MRENRPGSLCSRSGTGILISEERDGCPGKGKILPGNACSERLPRPGLSAAWRLPGDILKRLRLRDFFCYASKQPFLCERMLQVTRVLRSPETSGICPVADTGPGATPDPWRSPWGGREGVTPHRRTPSPGAKKQPSRTREPFPGDRSGRGSGNRGSVWSHRGSQDNLPTEVPEIVPGAGRLV